MMKRILIALLWLPLPVWAQFSAVPFVGMNSTRMSRAYGGYDKGGNFGVAGVEAEYMFKSGPYASVRLSLITGLSYLPNGFHETSNFSVLSAYYFHSQDLQMKYWQLPFGVRINWRPFPLMEDWRLFLGAGVSYNYLAYAHLAEESTQVAISWNDPLHPPPIVTTLSDSRTVTALGVKHPLFERFEIGMKFKHVQVTYRLSLSTQDMYFKGIEKSWKLPASESSYIDAHNRNGVTREKYMEIIFGWRLP
jgi:hypothetical protein